MFTASDVIRTYDFQVLALCFHGLFVLLNFSLFQVFGDIDVGILPTILIYFRKPQSKLRFWSHRITFGSGKFQNPTRKYLNAKGVSSGVRVINGPIMYFTYGFWKAIKGFA